MCIYLIQNRYTDYDVVFFIIIIKYLQRVIHL
jgi:hypothetical protein